MINDDREADEEDHLCVVWATRGRPCRLWTKPSLPLTNGLDRARDEVMIFHSTLGIAAKARRSGGARSLSGKGTLGISQAEEEGPCCV